jgi:hypothetical protein
VNAMTPPTPPPPAAPSDPITFRKMVWIAVVVVVAFAVAIAALTTIPVSQRYAFSFGGGSTGSGVVYFSDSWPEQICPKGASATISYSSTGLRLEISVSAPNGTEIWSDNATEGSTNFTVPACGSYGLEVSGSGDGTYTVDGRLSFRAPIL